MRTDPAVRHGSITVEIACRQCGLPIAMVAGEHGPEIADREQFLLVHHDCLVASFVPEQPTPGGRRP